MLLRERLTDVFIQDPRHETAYFIPAASVRIHHAPAIEAEFREKAVTFVLSYESLIEPLSDSSTNSAVAAPNVIIRDGDTGAEYALTFEELRGYEIERPEVHPEAKVFTLPIPEALVEEMPTAIRALLQTDAPSGRTGS